VRRLKKIVCSMAGAWSDKRTRASEARRGAHGACMRVFADWLCPGAGHASMHGAARLEVKHGDSEASMTRVETDPDGGSDTRNNPEKRVAKAESG
jgi:hypothetical protein